MSYYLGPNAVTDGLVLCLDTGNLKSYTSSSTLWYDLVSNNTCSILGNIYPFTYSAPPVSLTFPSIGQTSTYIVTSSFSMPTSDITVEMWVKFGATGYFGNALFSYATNANTNEFIFFFNNGLVVYGPAVDAYGPVWTIPSTTDWYQITRTRVVSTGLDNIYINGVLINSRTWYPGSSQTSGGTLILGQEQDAVGGGLDPNQSFYGGSISICRIYNRALSSDEVLQNYNAVKSRFNIVTQNQ